MHRSYVEIAGRTFEVELREAGLAPRLFVDGAAIAYDLRPAGQPGTWSLLLEARSHTVCVTRDGDALRIEIDGELVPVHIETEGQRLARRLRKVSGGARLRHVLKSPMPGIITKIHVRKGDAVARKAPLLAMEAMKMENELLADVDGTVEKVLVAPGAAVAANEDLIILGPRAEPVQSGPRAGTA